jgi:hypothetical protein
MTAMIISFTFMPVVKNASEGYGLGVQVHLLGKKRRKHLIMSLNLAELTAVNNQRKGKTYSVINAKKNSTKTLTRSNNNMVFSITPSFLEKRILKTKRARLKAPIDAQVIFTTESDQGIPTAIAKYKGQYYVLQSSGQGPYIIWQQNKSLVS